MIIAVICDMLGVVTKLIGPNKISDITNKISAGLTGKMDIDGIVSICVFLIVLYLVGTVLSYITSLIMTIVTQKLNKGLRTNISKKINNLPIGYFHKTTTGDVLSRVTNDVDTIGTTMQSSITTLVSAVTMFVGSIVMMVYTNVVMAITAILASVIGFILMFLIMGHSQKYFAAKQKWLGAMNGHIEEVYSGHNIVKLFNGEAKEKEKFIKLNEKMCESDWKSQFFSGLMQPIMAFIWRKWHRRLHSFSPQQQLQEEFSNFLSLKKWKMKAIRLKVCQKALKVMWNLTMLSLAIQRIKLSYMILMNMLNRDRRLPL